MILFAILAASIQADYNPKQWGIEVLEQIRREFYLPKPKLYAEQIGEDMSPAFNWPAGVMLSALAAAAKVEPKYKPWLKEYAEATRIYWNSAGPTPGYDVLPMPKSKDRYYDDNAWMCLALIETYEILKDKKFLQWAKETFQFVMSGQDKTLGGGIYWRENEKKSKNTCSNAPSALCAMRLAAKLEDPAIMETGDQLWYWTSKHLQDQTDHLYWDSISLSKIIDKTKWSYNTALMMRSALFRAGTTSHLEADSWYRRGKASLDSALAKWIDSQTGAIKDESAFAHLLFEALVEYQRASKSVKLDQSLQSALMFLRSKNRDQNGHYGSKWSTIASAPYKTIRLIDQASAARAFFVAAFEIEER